MSIVTFEEAFDAAIGAEKAAEQLFHGLKAKLSHDPDVIQLWKHYAEDEIMHANWLQTLEAKITKDELAQPVDEKAVKLLEVVRQVSIEKALARVSNLEDAYELVNDIEHGETNAIFRFLVDHFEVDRKMRHCMCSRLKLHVSRLSNDLPLKYLEVEARREVKANA